MFKRTTPAGERSAEERARAAAERAARRAAREGRPVGPPPPEAFGAIPAEPPPFVEPEPVFEPEPEPAAYVAPEPVADPTPEPAAYVAPEPEPPAQPEPAEPEPEPAEPEPAEPAEAEPEPETAPKSETAPEPEPETAPKSEPESKPEPAPRSETGPKPAVVSEPAPDPAPTPAEPPRLAAALDAEPDREPPLVAPADDATREWTHEETAAAVAPTPPPPEVAGPGDRTVEWTAPAPEHRPDTDPRLEPLPPLAPPPYQPAAPSAAEPPRRGRWRRDRKSGTLAPIRPRASAHRSRGHRRILAVLALAAIAGALYVINATFQPFHGDGRGAVRVTIPAGADVDDIGHILADARVIERPAFFSLNATLTRRRTGMKPGTYTMPRNLSYGAAIDALTQGPKAKLIKTFSLTIPEGRAAGETAPRLKGTSIEGDYVAASKSPALLQRGRRLGLPRGAKTLEGFLFPATYELPRGTTAAELVGRQLEGFADNTAKVSYRRARTKKLTRYDVLIIASMIEREAQLDRERPLIAAVIYNRLKRGMPLGIDATIRYATNNWTRPIRVSELQKDGPYNSRLRRGLPPTPIGNPGLASIRAATRPANVKYLYYVVKPGSKGAHAFSSTDAKFQRDFDRYQKARDAKGGQAP